MADISLEIELEDQQVEQIFLKTEKAAQKTALSMKESFEDAEKGQKALREASVQTETQIESNSAAILRQRTVLMKATESMKGFADTTTQVSNVFDQVNDSVDRTFDAFKTLGENVERVFSTLGVLVAFASRFGVVQNIFKKFGVNIRTLVIDLENAVDAVEELQKNFTEENIEKFGLALLSIGQSLGLVDKLSLRLVANLNRVSTQLDKVEGDVGFFDIVEAFSGYKSALEGTLASVVGLGAALAYRFRVPLLAAVDATRFAIKATRELGEVTTDTIKFFTRNTKNVFGFTAAIGGLATGLTVLGAGFTDSRNEFLRLGGTATLVAGLLLGGVAYAITQVVIGMGTLANWAGTQLVAAFGRSTAVFIEAEKQFQVFFRTVESFNLFTQGAVGPADEWIEKIEEISQRLNVSRDSLQKAGAEIVAVGNKIGLNREQLERLTEVSANYAKITGKDVFDISVKLLQGLTGQSQAVTSLGLKLTSTANQQFLLNEGLEEQFDKLSEGSKAQVRFINLIKQFQPQAAAALAVTNSLADANVRYENNLKRLNIELGRGAALIENNSLVFAGLNTLLDNVNSNVISAAGFMGALGARVLQIGGFFLTLAFKIFFVVELVKTLNLLTKSNFFASIMARDIPIVNASLDTFIRRLTGSQEKLRSMNSAVLLLSDTFTTVFRKAAKFFFGMEAATLTFGGAIKGLGGRIAAVTRVVAKFIAPFVSILLPIFLKLGAIVGAVVLAFYTLRDAFSVLEEETGFLSTFGEIFAEVFGSPSEILATIKEGIENFVGLIQKGYRTAVGFLAFSLSRVVGLFAELAATPLGTRIISDAVFDKVQKLNRRIAEFQGTLKGAGFDVAVFSKGVSNLASKGMDLLSVTIEDVNRLADELKNVGLTELQILQNTKTARLAIIDAALRDEIISEGRAADIRNKILQDFAIKQKVILDKMAEDARIKNQDITTNFFTSWSTLSNVLQDVARDMKTTFKDIGNAAIQGMGSAVTQGFAAVGEALVKQENALEAFGKAFLGIIGDLAIQLGQSFILQGIANSLNPLTPGSGVGLIAAGAALAAFGGALKASVGGGGGASGAAGGAGSSNLNGPSQLISVGEEDFDREPKVKEVNVIVQGNMLNTRESAVAIAELLNDSFDKEGIKIRGAV